MRRLLLFVGLIPTMTSGQRWMDSVILTQHGPMAYKPLHHNRYGYYTADVLPVYPGDGRMIDPGRAFAAPWHPYGNTMDIPITSGVNMGQPSLMTQMKSMPMKRKKSTLKKNPYYLKKPQQTPRQKPMIESALDQRYNDMRNGLQSSYPYRGRRFLNRGAMPRQSEKILKGQVIDHNKGRQLQENPSNKIRNKNDVNDDTVDERRVNHYYNNGHQRPDHGSSNTQ